MSTTQKAYSVNKFTENIKSVSIGSIVWHAVGVDIRAIVDNVFASNRRTVTLQMISRNYLLAQVVVVFRTRESMVAALCLAKETGHFRPKHGTCRVE